MCNLFNLSTLLEEVSFRSRQAVTSWYLDTKLNLISIPIRYSSTTTQQKAQNQNHIAPIIIKIPNPNQLPCASTFPAVFVFVNGALSVSLAGAPGLEVAAPDCVLAIVEVTASPSTVVDVRIVVVLSCEVADEDLAEEITDDSIDDTVELPEFETVATFVTVEGSPETVFVRSIVTGNTTVCVLPFSVLVMVVCTTRVNSVVAVVVVVWVWVWVWVSLDRLDALFLAASTAASGSGAPARTQVTSKGESRMSTLMSMQELCMQVTRSGRKLPEVRPARQRHAISVT